MPQPIDALTPGVERESRLHASTQPRHCAGAVGDQAFPNTKCYHAPVPKCNLAAKASLLELASAWQVQALPGAPGLKAVAETK